MYIAPKFIFFALAVLSFLSGDLLLVHLPLRGGWEGSLAVGTLARGHHCRQRTNLNWVVCTKKRCFRIHFHFLQRKKKLKKSPHRANLTKFTSKSKILIDQLVMNPVKILRYHHVFGKFLQYGKQCEGDPVQWCLSLKACWEALVEREGHSFEGYIPYILCRGGRKIVIFPQQVLIGVTIFSWYWISILTLLR